MRFRVWNKTENLNICFVWAQINSMLQIDRFLHHLNSFWDPGATLCRAVLPSCPSQRGPSLSLLGGRGMSWENKLQTLYDTSSPCISWVSPRLLVSWPCVIPQESSCAFFSSPTVVLRAACCAQYQQERLATSPTSTTLIFIKWGEQTAAVRAKRRQHFEQASLQEPSCTSDRRQL